MTVQGDWRQGNRVFASGGVHSVAVSVAAPVLDGNTVCALLGWDNLSAIVSFTDNAAGGSNTYTISPSLVANGERWQVAYCDNVHGAPTTFTVVNSPTAGAMLLSVDEYQGPLNFVAGARANSNSSGNVTTPVNGCLIWGGAVVVTAEGINSGAGFTVRTNNYISAITTEDLIQATAGAIAATFVSNAQLINLLSFVQAFRPVDVVNVELDATEAPDTASFSAEVTAAVTSYVPAIARPPFTAAVARGAYTAALARGAAPDVAAPSIPTGLTGQEV